MSRIREETWRVIPEFPNYEVSDLGNVFNIRFNKQMRISYNNYGHAKISLIDRFGNRFTRSVAQIVAEVFVEAPNPLCDQVVLLDGDFYNVSADNLVWRPRWFGWKYTRQLKIPQPIQFHNLPVLNTITDDRYSSIVAAGMVEGLLFEDIWRSTYTKASIFPHGYIFEIMHRV